MAEHGKKDEKNKNAGLGEVVRKVMTLFNPGAAAIEGKVTPAIKKATKKAKKSARGK